MAVETTPGNLPLASLKQELIDSLKQELIDSLPEGKVWTNSDTCVTGNLMFLTIDDVDAIAHHYGLYAYTDTDKLNVAPYYFTILDFLLVSLADSSESNAISRLLASANSDGTLDNYRALPRYIIEIYKNYASDDPVLVHSEYGSG